MQSVASILDRFRRSAGVPAAAADDVAGELAPVFAALEQLEAEAQAIRDAAVREADQLLEETEARVAETVAAWHEQAQAERRRAESDCERAAARRAEAVEAEARAEAALLRERGRERIAGLVDEVLACVRMVAR
jgi:hypothetical protein